MTFGTGVRILNEMQQIEADIISRCKAGDKAAFRNVVQNCQGMVYSLSLKMLADIEEAKDVVQDTFIKVVAEHRQLR